MLDILQALAHGVGDMTYGDPDDADAVKAADVVRWAVAEIERLREGRRWVEGQVVISRETFDKVVAALSRCTIVADDDGDEWNDDEVFDAWDSIRRDADMIMPGPEKKEVPRG
jgi:hypothetical protein